MMSRTNRAFVLLSGLGVFILAFYFGFDRYASADTRENRIADFSHSAQSLPEAEIKRDFGSLPLYFTAARTASPEDVMYFSVGNRYGLSLTRSGIALQLVTENPAANTANGSNAFEGAKNFSSDQIKLRFAGADFSRVPAGEEELAGKVNYLVGDAARWQTNNPTFAKVRYKSIYPGIDALFYGSQRELEYDFLVAPGADPKIIALEFDGTKNIAIDKQGNLVLKLKNGDIVQRKPVAYQMIDGARQSVKVSFIKKGDNKIAFRLGKYNREKELIIDPVIIFSTFWGGSSTENATAVRTDAQGNIYLTGATVSPNFPTVNPLQPQINNGLYFDAFVTKINPAGNSVIYSTYLGGNSEDFATSLSVDESGNAVVAGRTYSTNFPTVNAQQTQSGGSADGFAAKLNAAGSALIFSTYLGGSGFEEILSAKLDSTGRTVLAGRTDSGDFPTVGAIQTNLSGASFFHSGNSGGSWTGGSLSAGVNNIASLAVGGSSSNIVFAATNRGVYRSTDGGTNWSAVGLSDLSAPVSKIVVARSNSNTVYAISNGIIFKSTNGGDNWTNVQGTIFTSLISLAVDPTNADRVFAGGFSGAIFRTTDGGANWTNISITNVFNPVNSIIVDPANLQNIYAGTSQRIYKSTAGGGSWTAVMNGITILQTFSDLLIDPVTNTIYAAGQNGLYKSTDGAANWTPVNVANLTVLRSLAQDPANPANLYAATGTGLFFRSLDGGMSWNQISDGLGANALSAVAASSNTVLLGGYSGTDAFVARLTGAGNALDYSTYFGGNLNDSATSVEIGGDNRITFAGTTNSPNFPVANAIQSNLGGGTDAFVTKLNENGMTSVYSTFLGGASTDTATSVTVGGDGAAYVTGSTISTNFPVANAFQPSCASCSSFLNDAYVTKLNANGSGLVYSTYLGGTSSDNGLSIRVDSQNRVFVGGSTASANFPILDPIQPAIGGTTDGFVSQIKADGSGFIYSTFYGGSSTDSVTSLTIAPEGNAVIAGQTNSANFPTASPLQAAIGGGTDAFLAKIGIAADLRLVISDERDPVMINNPLNLNLQITNNGPMPATGVVVTENLPVGVNFVSATPTQGTCALNGSTLTCNLGNLALNAQASIRLNLTATQTGTISNTASVSGSEPDPVPANSIATEQTVISALPSIFGKVTTGSGQPAGDVGISLEGLQNRTVQTGSNGVYGFNELPLGGNYTVRPVKAGFYFAPRSKTFNSLTSDGTADFVMNACSYTLSADSAVLSAAGGNRSIWITTNDPFCTWAATSNAPWISVTNGASGVGNGTVKITVEPSSAQRTGTLTIAGKIFTVTQSGCAFTLTPFQQSYGQSGGSGSFEVKTNESFCQWTASASNPWITINGNPNGTGSGVVNYTVAPTTQPRGGRISVGGQNFAIYQEANYCPSPGFAAPVETISTLDSNDIVVGDFNNDSFPDLATVEASNSPAPTYSTYLNTGTGTFNRNTIPSSIGSPTSIVAADFNGDSTIDLALHGAGKIAIYTNNGTAGFTLLGSFDAPSSTYSTLYNEDFNRDGKMDLIVGVSDRIQVFTGNGNGTFTAGFSQPLTGRFTYSFAFGDLNGDGVTDAVVGQEEDFNLPRLVYFFGTANGTFTAGGVLSHNLVSNVKIADVNGDGKGDVITSGVGASQVQVLLWNPATNGFKSPIKVFSDPFNAHIFEVADIDNDGKADIVTASSQGNNRVTVIRGNGNGTFRLPIGFASSTYMNTMVFSDFNRDGRLDIAFAKKNNQMSFQLGQCNSSATAANRAPVSTRFDFDGDRKADFAVVRPSNNTWYVYQGANQPLIYQPFGQSGDIFVPADYDGDGRTDFAVFRPSEGLWYRLNSSDNSLSIFNWGKSGDIPVAADFDGDERADLAVYRPDENLWYWLSTLNGQIHTIRFGLSEDVPVVGDYDGDGKADIAVFRPSDGVWYWLNSSNGDFQSYKFGLAKDKAVPGDYDGDGQTDFAVFRSSEGLWYIMKSSLRQSGAVNFGKEGDVPVAADYDGDGKTDISVFRNGVWYVLKSASLEMLITQFGIAEDKPVPSMYIR